MPSIYTLEEFHSKCKEYPWLTTDEEGRLLCSTCKEVSTLKIDQAQGVYIRSQWVTGGVSYSGDNVSKQKTSLRRKIYDHKNSYDSYKHGRDC